MDHGVEPDMAMYIFANKISRGEKIPFSTMVGCIVILHILMI